SFTEKDVAEIVCLGLTEDRTLRQPELICYVRSSRRQSEIESKIDAAEHHCGFAVPATAEHLQQALRDIGLLTPVGAATILLVGRHTFGTKWFEDALAAAG